MGKRRDILWLVALLAVAALLFRPAPPRVEPPTRRPASTAAAVPETATPAVARTTPVDLSGLWTLDQFLEAARTDDPNVAARAGDVWKKLSDRPEPSALGGSPDFRQGDLDEAHASGFLVVDGNAQVSFLQNAVLIATGRVTVAHSAHSLILCGGRLDISHDGSENQPSIVVSGDFAEISHATGTVIAARRGLELSWAHQPVRAINTRLLEATQNVLLLESPEWPYKTQLAPPVGNPDEAGPKVSDGR